MLDGLTTSTKLLTWPLALIALALAVGVPGATAGSGSAAADPAACPLKASSTIPSGEAWAFTETGAPSTPHPGIASSYTHGRGTWAGGRGRGTICNEDTVSAHPSHNLVLAVAGAARTSPEITRLGHLGVGLVLKLAVSASDDPACPAGTRGTATLFASYFQGHHDSIALRFTGSCGAYDFTYSGSQVHVVIADNGGAVR